MKNARRFSEDAPLIQIMIGSLTLGIRNPFVLDERNRAERVDLMGRQWLEKLAEHIGSMKKTQDEKRREILLKEERFRELLPGFWKELCDKAEEIAKEYNTLRGQYGLGQLASFASIEGTERVLAIRYVGEALESVELRLDTLRKYLTIDGCEDLRFSVEWLKDNLRIVAKKNSSTIEVGHEELMGHALEVLFSRLFQP